MGFPGNGIYVVQGEMTILLTAMRRGSKWSPHYHLDDEYDPLIRNFIELKEEINQIGDLREIDPNQFLTPFLDVIRSEETTGPVTSLALSSINKFLSYGLIDPNSPSVPSTVENIADTVTHARFVGTDQASDGVVLMKILQVLRTLILSPEGALLTNESICEIMLSCFRICFESRLSELLRRTAEHCLKDMVQLLFARLPSFTEELHSNINLKKLKMRAGSVDNPKSKRKSKLAKNKNIRLSNYKLDKASSKEKLPLLESETKSQSTAQLSDDASPVDKMKLDMLPMHLATTPVSPAGNILDMQGSIHPSPEGEDICTPDSDIAQNCIPEVPNSPDSKDNTISSNLSIKPNFSPENKEPNNLVTSSCVVINVEPEFSNIYSDEYVLNNTDNIDDDRENLEKSTSVEDISHSSQSLEIKVENESINKEYINLQGVRFMPQDAKPEDTQSLLPYGLLCVRELFRFLVSLCNPKDKQNNETMIHMGLTLLTVAVEIGGDNIKKFNSLLVLVKDELCRNLINLLNSDRISIFAANLQLAFLLFENMRTHLKFQLELFLTKLSDIIISDSSKILYEQKEIALESLVNLWRIPGLVTELYLNYDCDLYSPNLFEDLTKLISKNAFPVSGTLYNTHLLSLDALLTIIETIESHCHNRILNEKSDRIYSNQSQSKNDQSKLNLYPSSSSTKVSRQKVSENIPTHEQLMALKYNKKLLSTGTEHFNIKPKKGIQFLQEHEFLSNPFNPEEIVKFLKENPRLDKKMIGEYISNRDNPEVLDTFVKSFDFSDMRIDEALRLYLETFRLPGESPLISVIMEHFSHRWHESNGRPFANADASFTLAYAIIMLNVDQHNHNVKKQNNPMTCEEFKRNVKSVNGGKDFDQDMLDEIYNAIRNEEIVMPAEQSGIIRDNYLWKVLLRRGMSPDGDYIHAPNGLFDHDLFSLIWGPTVAALSFVFDKSNDINIYHKALTGFRKCAMISAHYGMSNDFDNLIISLCKFTLLLNNQESPETLTLLFGSNQKAQLASKTVFTLAHKHGDIIREGWKNVLDCILQLYRCKLLPKELIEADDFIELNGKISLLREEIPSQKTETGLFSSLYSYIASTSDTSTNKYPSSEDQEHIEMAKQCVEDCHLESLITESKFLQIDSLAELVKVLIFASHGPDGHVSLNTSYDEDAAVFFLELLLKIVIQNRDRVSTVWKSVRDHIYSLMMGSSVSEHHFLLERSVVGLLRMGVRLMRKEDMSPIVLQSLRMLLLLKTNTLFRVSRQVSYGLYELLKTSAANIHTDTDWSIIFTLFECVGAGALPPKVVGDSSKGSFDQNAKSDGEIGYNEEEKLLTERGCTSDSELTKVTRPQNTPVCRSTSPELSPNNGGGWILVGREGEIQPLQIRHLPINQFSIVHERELGPHDPYALVKCCESLAFLVRDLAHITPYNFENCVHCIRTCVEAALHTADKKSHKVFVTPLRNRLKHSDKRGYSKDSDSSAKSRRRAGTNNRKRASELNEYRNTGVVGSSTKMASQTSSNPVGGGTSAYDADESDSDEMPNGYHQSAIQLLDLMHTLHTRTAHIYRWWAQENKDTSLPHLWSQAWCPLLQGIARLCCDIRRQVRMNAITYLQRALLMPDLQTLTACEWESCFNQVLFPLLSKLLGPIDPKDLAGLEETRMRAATLLSKVFLHHLSPLLTLPTFTALWLTILDFMDKYMHADKSDLLYEAIPESLKNMLLVMDSARIFSSADGYSRLWTITWDRIGAFLPTLKDELFKPHLGENKEIQLESPVEGTAQETNETSVPMNSIPPAAVGSSIPITASWIPMSFAPPTLTTYTSLGQPVSTIINTPALPSGDITISEIPQQSPAVYQNVFQPPSTISPNSLNNYFLENSVPFTTRDNYLIHQETEEP